jgi:hypothetical protein
MDKSIKNLRIVSYLFLTLGVLDVVGIVALVYLRSNVSLLNVDSSTASAAVYAGILTFVVDLIVNLYLGGKGVKQAKGNPVGTLHIKVASVFFVLSIIGCAFGVYQAFKGGSVMTVIASLLDVVLYQVYRVNAKKVAH